MKPLYVVPKDPQKTPRQNPFISFTSHASREFQTKEYWISTDNTIKKQASPQMHTGTAKRITTNLEGFINALNDADSYTTFSYGDYLEHLPDEIEITTKKNEDPKNNKYSRSRHNYRFKSGAGVMMLDFDHSPYGPTISVGEFIKLWYSLDANAPLATQVIRGSISSGVHVKGEPSPFEYNCHVYVWVEDASDIPRYTKALAGRLWLAGYGFYALAANGCFLDKTVIDMCVFTPERLDFVGAPRLLSDQLIYDPPEIRYKDRGLLPTCFFGDLSEDELEQINLLKLAAKESMKVASQCKHDEYNAKQIARMMMCGASWDDAKTTIDKMDSEAGKLYDDYTLIFSDGTGEVSVREVIANPAKYNGRNLYDPVEGPGYDNGSDTVARYYYNADSDTHIVNSFAHGGQKFILCLSAFGVRKKVRKTAEFESMNAKLGASEDPEPKTGWKPVEEKHYEDKVTSSDMDDKADTVEAPDYLINDVLVNNHNGIVGGSSMTFKTFVMLAMAHSVCTGLPFFGHQVFRTGKVLYVCGEGKAAFARRVRAIKIVNGDFNNNLFMVDQHLRIDDAACMDNLRQHVLELKPVLIIFDTFASLITATDENSNSEVGKVIRLIKESCIEGETSTIVVHHYGKDSSKGLRGASGFLGNVDFTWEMTRVPDTKLAMLHCVKNKDEEDFKDIMMQAHVVELGLIRQDGTQTTSLVMKPTTEKPAAPAKKLDAKHTYLLDALFEMTDKQGISPPQIILDKYKSNLQKCPQKVLDIDVYRNKAYLFLDVAPNSKRQSLKRCLERLQENNKAIYYGGYVWPI